MTRHLNRLDMFLGYALGITAEVTDMDIIMDNLVNLKRFILSKRKAEWQGVDKGENKPKSIDVSLEITFI